MAKHFLPRGPWANPALLSDPNDEFVTSTDVQRQFGECVARVRIERHTLVVLAHNRPVLAMIHIDELRRLRALAAQVERSARDGCPDCGDAARDANGATAVK